MSDELRKDQLNKITENDPIKDITDSVLVLTQTAGSLEDYVWYSTLYHIVSDSEVRNAYGIAGDATEESFYQMFDDEKSLRLDSELTAERIQAMYNKMKHEAQNSGENDGVQIRIERFSESGYPEYQIMAIFPPEKQIFSYANIPRPDDQNQPIIMYHKLIAACNEQAAEELMQGVESLQIVVPYQNGLDLMREMDFKGGQENYRLRNEHGEVIDHRPPAKYLLATAMGLFANETKRYILPQRLMDQRP